MLFRSEGAFTVSQLAHEPLAAAHQNKEATETIEMIRKMVQTGMPAERGVKILGHRGSTLTVDEIQKILETQADNDLEWTVMEDNRHDMIKPISEAFNPQMAAAQKWARPAASAPEEPEKKTARNDIMDSPKKRGNH